VQRALDARRGSYSPGGYQSLGECRVTVKGFKARCKFINGDPWQGPHTSVDAQCGRRQLKYFFYYRRALQQVSIMLAKLQCAERAARPLLCADAMLLNYAHWCIVSPESSPGSVEKGLM